MHFKIFLPLYLRLFPLLPEGTREIERDIPVANVIALSLGEFSKNISFPLQLHLIVTCALKFHVLSGMERVLLP